MHFEKHAFNAWVEKPAFYHPLKSLMLTHYNPCIKIVFLENTFNARSVKRMFYKMPVLGTLLDIRKTCRLPCVKRTFTMRLKKTACFTHVAHFPV